MGVPVQSSPALGPDGALYVGANDGAVHVLHGDTGAVLATFAIADPGRDQDVPSSPVLAASGGGYLSKACVYLCFAAGVSVSVSIPGLSLGCYLSVVASAQLLLRGREYVCVIVSVSSSMDPPLSSLSSSIHQQQAQPAVRDKCFTSAPAPLAQCLVFASLQVLSSQLCGGSTPCTPSQECQSSVHTGCCWSGRAMGTCMPCEVRRGLRSFAGMKPAFRVMESIFGVGEPAAESLRGCGVCLEWGSSSREAYRGTGVKSLLEPHFPRCQRVQWRGRQCCSWCWGGRRPWCSPAGWGRHRGVLPVAPHTGRALQRKSSCGEL